MRCINCGSMIEAGLHGRPPVVAKYCLKCRSERRRQHVLKYEWAPKHDAYLREHYHGGLHQRGRIIRALARVTGFPQRLLGRVSAVTIAKKLKRTEASVVMKIKALGNSRRVCEGYTMRDLEACLGEDHHKIQRWIANGWLRDRLQGTNRRDGNGHDIHRFLEKDILNFMKTHSREINLGKVEPTWFWDLILRRGAEIARPEAP